MVQAYGEVQEWIQREPQATPFGKYQQFLSIIIQ
jgi:hypothetical protein